ncbi:acetyltransferase [Enterococcus sp. JM4C]|uniref:GNAT family N-acetyltransferase n=1 Tax=Candidatus Enterococcus huntleyi TaxID=1857217 RepID=UPI001379A92B|nr:GNAT family N-acetyltransferase [Enterococcus sp. JM4C]KAF1297561.1 acetyltransferase [Enterococcus sp. JM4C]
MNIYWEADANRRAAGAEKVLTDLPEWFGLPESTKEYIANTKNYATLFVSVGNEVVGFLSIKQTAEKTAEIDCMGILKSAQRQGYGHHLIEETLRWCKERGYLFLQVKTLADTHPDIYYQKTRAFYRAAGFCEVQIFPDLWGPENPCLQMIRAI